MCESLLRDFLIFPSPPWTISGLGMDVGVQHAYIVIGLMYSQNVKPPEFVASSSKQSDPQLLFLGGRSSPERQIQRPELSHVLGKILDLAASYSVTALLELLLLPAYAENVVECLTEY